jgi:hypothetical protein
MDEPPATACSFKCVNNIEYYVHEYRKGVVFRIFVPEICQIWKVDLIGDVKGPRWTTYCQFLNSPHCYGQLTGSWSDLGIIPGRIFEVNTVGNEPVPGELFKVWVWMHGTPLDDCNPVLLAQGYYSHPCFTSGEIQEILLVNEDDTIEDSVSSGETPDSWIGDTRLKYRIQAEGELMIVKPSDFFRYGCGERVFVHKGGVTTKQEFTSKFTGAYGTLAGQPQDAVVAGCQDPHDASEFDIYSWRQVRAIEDTGEACIIPYKCYGIP